MKIATVALLILLTVPVATSGQSQPKDRSQSAPVWYWLQPPPTLDGHKAPLKEWRIEDAFDSAAECRKAARTLAGGWVVWEWLQRREDDIRERRAVSDMARADDDSRATHIANLRGVAEQVRQGVMPWWAERPEEERRKHAAGLEQKIALLEKLAADPAEARRFKSETELVEIHVGLLRQQVTWKCLPSEALPPGMLPLK